MDETRRCPECGTEVEQDGACPACLMKLGLSGAIPPMPEPEQIPPPSPVATAAVLRTGRGLRWSFGWKWPAAAVAAVIAVLFFAALFPRGPEPIRGPVVRFTIPAPDEAAIEDFAVSADGRALVFTAGRFDGRTTLWRRSFDEPTSHELPGTEGAGGLFWSPDSAWLGFFAQGKLKKTSVDGGPPQTLCDAPAGRGGTWNRDGVIVFAPGTGALYRVSAAGGVPAPVTNTTGSQGFPQFLPDGHRFLYLAREGPDTSGISIGSLDGTPPVRLLPDDSNAAYVSAEASAPSSASRGARGGYLLFVRQTTLMAQPFDPNTLRTTGEMFPVVQQVGGNANSGLGQFSTSENGALVYANSGETNRELVWMDRAGKLMGPSFPAGSQADLRLAPDENRVVFSRVDSGNTDIWVRDLRRGVPSRLSFDPAIDNLPIWSPDGLRVLWPSNRNGGVFNLYIKSATGAGQEELFLKLGTPTGWATDWSHDGRFILYQISGGKTGQDLWIAPQTQGKAPGDDKPFPYLQGPFNEQNGAFSPDGRWIAYVSNESGKDEVYVQSFPLSGGRWQISAAGGTGPRWRRDGTELFYVAADRNLTAVPVRAVGASFEPGIPHSLFPTPSVSGFGFAMRDEYAVSADGNRFLVARPAGDAPAAPLTVVLHWQAGLKK